jgi:hypothetical protein
MLRPTVSRPVCLGVEHPSGAYDKKWLLAQMAFKMKYESQSQVKVTLRLTVSQSVSLGVEPIWGSWPDIYYSLTITVLFLWGALSDDRTGLFFVYAAGSSLGTRDHILLSQIWDFPFRRLLRPAGSRWRHSTPPPCGWLAILSLSHIATDGQSVCLSWCQAPSGAHDQILVTVWQFLSCLGEGALSDERVGLSFVRACQQ